MPGSPAAPVQREGLDLRRRPQLDHDFALDAELAEVSPPVGLGNPALRQFWNFEASTAGARAYLEFGLGYEIGDQNFEQIPQRLVLPRPRLTAHGKVNRTMARAISALMYYEQQQVIGLQALLTANRSGYGSLLSPRPPGLGRLAGVPPPPDLPGRQQTPSVTRSRPSGG